MRRTEIVAEHPEDGRAAGKLIEQANQIAAFFRPYPEPEACAGIAKHISDFWPRGKRQALGDLIARGGSGLDPLLVRALSLASDRR